MIKCREVHKHQVSEEEPQHPNLLQLVLQLC